MLAFDKTRIEAMAGCASRSAQIYNFKDIKGKFEGESHIFGTIRLWSHSRRTRLESTEVK